MEVLAQQVGAGRGGKAAAAMRLLGLDADSVDDVEQARRAARSAIAVPDDLPALAADAERLLTCIDEAAAVLTTTAVAEPPTKEQSTLTAEDVAATPPTPPVPPMRGIAGEHPPSRSIADVAQDPQAPPEAASSAARRSRALRVGGYIFFGAVLAAVAASGMTLASGGPPQGRTLGRTIPSFSVRTSATAPATVDLPIAGFLDRLISGELAPSPAGLEAAAPQEALAGFLLAVAGQDVAAVSRGLDAESRRTEVAEVFQTLGPTPASFLTCGPAPPVATEATVLERFACGPNPPTWRDVEVVRTQDGWRVHGWIP